MTEDKKNELKEAIKEAIYTQEAINSKNNEQLGIGIANMINVAFDVIIDYLDKDAING